MKGEIKMIWLTSDLHLFHNQKFIYENRGFGSIGEMNAEIERLWNGIVADDDEVYILGDLMVCGKSGSNEAGMDIVRRLKGKKHIIIGNHDTKARIAMYEKEDSVVDVQYATMFRYKGYNFYLSHYPTITTNLEHETLKQGIINLFGHTHSKEKFFNNIPFMYNVALDAHENRPVSIDEVLEEIKEMYAKCSKS
jgi:calcineurin-like phosphoesterase family protein